MEERRREDGKPAGNGLEPVGVSGARWRGVAGASGRAAAARRRPPVHVDAYAPEGAPEGRLRVTDLQDPPPSWPLGPAGAGTPRMAWAAGVVVGCALMSPTVRPLVHEDAAALI